MRSAPTTAAPSSTAFRRAIWRDTRTDDVNWRVVEGYGATVAAYGADLPVVLDCPVRRIDHGGKRLDDRNRQRRDHRRPGDRDAADRRARRSRAVRAGAAATRPRPRAGLPLGLADKLFLSLDGAEEFEQDSRLFGRTDRAATGSYHLRPFGRPLIEVLFRRRAGLASWKPDGDARVLRLRGVASSPACSAAPSRAASSRSACIAGAPTRSRAAPIHTRCRARRIAAPRSPRRWTTGCSSPARPARSPISPPRTARSKPASPPPMH